MVGRILLIRESSLNDGLYVRHLEGSSCNVTSRCINPRGMHYILLVVRSPSVITLPPWLAPPRVSRPLQKQDALQEMKTIGNVFARACQSRHDALSM